MTSERNLRFSFRSRVEQKIVLLVLLCAVLPMAVLSFVAMREIEAQKLTLAEQQLRGLTKTYALDLLDRLDHAMQDLKILHLGGADESQGGLVSGFERLQPMAGDPRPELSRQGSNIRIRLPIEGYDLIGEVSFDVLFESLGHVPFGIMRCIELDDVSVGCAGTDIQGDVLETHWELPLSSVYQTGMRLQVRSSQQLHTALEHVSLISRILPLAMLLVAAVIAWLLTSLIRRRVAPLAALQEATRSIQDGDYTTSVRIDTGDEFERLGDAFNVMTARMGRAFEKMHGLAEIDRLILSGARVEDVIEHALLLANDHYVSTCYVYMWHGHPKQGQLYEIDHGQLDTTELCLLPGRGGDREQIDYREALAGLLPEAPGTGHELRIEGLVSGELFTTGIADGLHTSFSTLAELADRIAVAGTNAAREQALYRRANYDALTGLINRQAFSDRLAEAVKTARRRDVQGALLFLDLDRFKKVNDTGGHGAGDQLLRVVGERLTEVLRVSDTVARLGGDEFGIIVPDCGSESELIVVCRRVIEAVSLPVRVDRIRHEVDVSVGVSLFPNDGLDPGTLLMKADVAMYQAKSQGGSAFAFFDQSLNELTERRVHIESGMRSAMDEGRLRLHYQPKVELATMRVRGLEGLLRWEGETDFVYGPAEFIPVAEETGLIHQFTDLLIAESARCLTRCRTENLGVERVAVNISTRQFSVEGFAGKFLAAIERSGLQPADLEIEITESLFVGDAEHVSGELAHLRGAGVHIALDDFGTGYSSLNMLRTLPLNTVKIDRSFITPLIASPEAREVAQKIIEMAAALNLAVVAEGVEEWPEVELLRRLGCHYVQGYVISRPLPLDDIVPLLHRFSRGEEGQEFRISGLS